MTYLVARAVLPLFMFLSATLLLIQAQPYDDHDLRDLLLPEGCRAPCFLGICPGGTTVDEAMQLLKQDARVAKVTTRYDVFLYRPVVNWLWNNPQHQESNPDSNGFVYQLEDKQPIVQALRATPGLAMGYINLILGKPTCQITAFYPFELDKSYFVLVYRERLLVASAPFDARYHFDYRTPAHLEYISPTTLKRIGYPMTLCGA